MMKKLIAMILALMMIGSLALAEEADMPQEQMASRFGMQLQRSFQRIMQLSGRDAVLDVRDESGEVLNARLQAKDGMVSLKARTQNGSQEMLIQANDEGIWALISGQAVGLRFSDLAGMAQAGIQMPQVDSRIYEVIFQMLADETVMKGIEVTREGAATHIAVNLEVKALLEGFVRWMDDVMQVPRCREAVVPLFDYYLSMGGTPMSLEEQWPSMREQLLAVETDAKLTGEITSALSGSNTEGTLTCTEGEAEYDLTFSAQTARTQQPTVEVKISGNGGRGEVKDLYALRFVNYARSGNFRAELEQIQEGSTIVLNGTAGDETLQLDLSGYPQEKIPFTAHLFIRSTGDLRDGFEARFDAADQRSGESVNLSLNLSEEYQSFRLRAGGEEYSAVAQEDRTGKLVYAALTTPGFDARYESGKFTYRDSGTKVTVTSSFESATVNLLDVVTENRYSAESVRRQVRTEILPAETGAGPGSIRSTVLDENGQSVGTVALSAAEQEAIPLISEMNPTMLTPEMLRMLTER